MSRQLRLAVAVAALVLVIDQLTKHWALNRLGDGSTIDLVWTLRFNLAFNTGMAFSQGTGLGPFISVVVVVIVVVLLRHIARTPDTFSALASGLVIGGAVGNLVDRLFRGEAWLRGAVVDFIDLQWFPIFNVADAAVVIGGGLLVLAATRHRGQAEHDSGRSEESTPG